MLLETVARARRTVNFLMLSDCDYHSERKWETGPRLEVVQCCSNGIQAYGKGDASGAAVKQVLVWRGPSGVFCVYSVVVVATQRLSR